MLSFADSQIDSGHFAQYVTELREFSSSHHVPTGSPAQLPDLLDRLNHSPDFRAECTSMLRSIFYREHGHAAPEDLLLLLIVAWGGQPSAPPTPALQATITDLLRFAARIMRTPVSPPDLPDAQPQAGVQPAPEPLPPPQPAPHSIPAAAPADEPAVTAAPRLAHSQFARMDEIESAIQLLAIRSPDVKRYLHLLKQREIQRRTDQHRVAQRHGAPEEIVRRHPAHTLPTWQVKDAPALTPSAPAPLRLAQAPPRESPWDPESEFQIELRRFAAHREAERQAHITAHEAHRPASAKLADVAESAWNRLLRRYREP